MDKLTTLSVAELGTAYRSRQLSPVEVTRAFFDRIEAVDSELCAFVTLTSEIAYDQARVAERQFASGESVGDMTGIPVAVKDAFHVAGYPTSLGSLLYRDLVSKNDSGVVQRLKRAGAVLIGKANTAEFGQSATSDNLLGPDTKNPWDPSRTPGGSSGGSATAVAARLSAVAVGSDGGGSVRIPAAFSGIFGLKTSYGLCSDEKGFRAMTDFVGPGPMASSVADARALLGVLAGGHYARKGTGKLRIAYALHPDDAPVEAGVAASVQKVAWLLSDMGHEVVEVNPPMHGWEDIFGPLVLEDEHRERGHLLAHHADQLTNYERSSLIAAQKLDSADVQRAQELLPEYRATMEGFLTEYDVILTPSTAVPAFPLGERVGEVEGQKVSKLWGAYPFSSAFNVAGVTAASVPCGMTDGLPVGAQLVAANGREQLLLDLSEDLEEQLDFDTLEAAAKWQLAREATV